MSGLMIRRARVLTLDGPGGPRRGGALRDLGVRVVCDVRCEGGRVAAIGENLRVQSGDHEVNADGCVLMPGFVDCHTHLCWAGSRVGEWEQRLAGATYLDILAAGGGIMSTVRAVRAASTAELAELLLGRLRCALATGTTTIEIKSGYGLDTATELKMLRAIDLAASQWPGTVVKTACIGHAIDPDEPNAVERTVCETLDAVHAEFPGLAIDAYCEKGAWSVRDCERLFERAADLGHPCRVHADQFNALGMTAIAVERGFASVDHLEASTNEGLQELAESGTHGVMLPCSGFHLDQRYANGRRFVDYGGALAIATNCNPGSAPCSSMPMTIALATRYLGLTPSEAIACATVNATNVLGLTDRGRIAAGCRADLILLSLQDERELAHSFGMNPVESVIVAGEIVW